MSIPLGMLGLIFQAGLGRDPPFGGPHVHCIYFKITKNIISSEAQVKIFFSGCKICVHARLVRSMAGPAGRAGLKMLWYTPRIAIVGSTGLASTMVGVASTVHPPVGATQEISLTTHEATLRGQLPQVPEPLDRLNSCGLGPQYRALPQPPPSKSYTSSER
jgi:hypothetical protein